MPMAKRKDLPKEEKKKAENGTVEQASKQKKSVKHAPKGNKPAKVVQDDLALRPLLADITKHPAIFSYDSSFFFCTFSKQVLMYSTTTGEMTHPFYHPTEVVGIVPHPNKKELFSFTETGKIYVWDYSDGRLIMTLNANTRIASIAASRHLSKIYIVGQNGQIQSINLLQENLSPKNIGTPMVKAKSVVSNESGKYVCVMTDTSLTLFDTSNGTSKVMNQLKPTTFTCLAIHPSLSIAAVGDSKGSIFLWYFSSESSELTNAPASNLHWHSNPVRSLVFTDEGLHLLSGGSEGVLVQWSLEQNKKTFLPRLRSAIDHISMDQTGKFIAVSMRNNFIQLIDALSQSVILKTLGISVENKSLNLMTIDPYSKLLVVNSSRGTLQFCDPTTGRPNFELDILSSVNAITGANGDLKLPVITSAGLSPNSTYIVTVVCVANEEVLQFWNYDPVTKTLSLNTQLGSPHGKGKVKAIAQHPNRDLVVTFGTDANFKFWLRDGESKDKQRKFWKCRSVTGYRDLIPNGGCFSQDGSVLAISHDHTVTLWETSTLALRGTLCAWPSTEKVKHVGFIPDRPHLVCVTDGGLYVWDIVSYSIVWSYNGKISSLGIDNYDPVFAVVESAIGGLLLFDSFDPQPVFKVPHAILQDSSSRVLTTFVSRSGESSLSKPVVIIGLSDTVLVAEHEREPQAPVQMAQHARAYKSAPEVPSKVVAPAKKPREQQLPALHTGNMSLFDTPSHVIPPVSALFAPFMDSLVARKQTTASTAVAQKSSKEAAPSFKKPDVVVEKEKTNDEDIVDANYNSLGSIFKKRKPDTPGSASSKRIRTTPTTTPTATPTSTPAKTPATETPETTTPAKIPKTPKNPKTPKTKTPAKTPAPTTPTDSTTTPSTPTTTDSVTTATVTPTPEFKTPAPKTPKRSREETEVKDTEQTTETAKKTKTPAATPVKSTKTPVSSSSSESKNTTPAPVTQQKKPQPDTPHPKTRPTPPPPATPVQHQQKNAKNPDTPRPPSKPATNGKEKENGTTKENGVIATENVQKETPKKTPAKQATKTPAKTVQTPAPKTPANNNNNNNNDNDAPVEEVSVSKKSAKKAPTTPAASALTTPTRKLFDDEGQSAETPTETVLKNPMTKENMEQKEHKEAVVAKTPKTKKTPAKSTRTPAK